MKIIIITSIPSFYKDNLFVKLQEKCALSVLYTNNVRIKREPSFYTNYFTNTIFLSKWNYLRNILFIYKSRKYDSIILSGWDDIYYWFARFILPKSKLKIIIESSFYEYKKNKILDFLKIFFLKGIHRAIVSGSPQEYLIQNLKFQGDIIKSYGVGVLDFKYTRPLRVSKYNINKFIFIGRIAKVKGIDLLLKYFKNNKQSILYLVGNYEDLSYKKDIDNIFNIKYLGYKNREELTKIFLDSDVLILPSIQEPWGLVVEEAIYHGLPVIVSNNVGCSIDIVKNNNLGLIFESENYLDFETSINKMSELKHYEFYRDNIYNYDFRQKELTYINSFLND